MKEPASFLTTQDGIDIAYEHRRRGAGRLVIVCPGFFNSQSNRWIKKTVEIVGQKYDTLVFDFRGHGASSGWFTWLAKEHLDVEAVLNYVEEFGYKKIGILAYSLGAAASINYLGRQGKVDSLFLVSTPASFWEVNYHFWEPEMFSDLFDNFSCGWEGKGVKWGNMFSPKRRPITEIAGIKDTPKFFVHGTSDWIVKDTHSRRLYDKALEPKNIELIKGGLHAERMVQQFPDKMEALFMDWFEKTL